MNFMRMLMLAGILGGCLVWSGADAIADDMSDLNSVAQANTVFALDLYARLQTEPGNLFFSPYSLSSALVMVYAGARGATETHMAQTLHFSTGQAELHPAFARLTKQLAAIQQQDKLQLTVANALWVQQDFELLKTYRQLTETYYGANLFPVNFKEASAEARQKINGWVEEHTQKKIQELVPPGVLNALTRLVLTNAIYFKGIWALPFDHTLTSDAPFWVTPAQSVTVPLMHQQAMLKYGETEALQILELPYAGENLAMLVLLPKQQAGLADVEGQLSESRLTEWIADAAYRQVDVFLPRFTVTSQLSLRPILTALGMDVAFSDQADFSGMIAQAQVSISDVLHKAFIDVNEEGTEAAAATGVVIGVTSIMDPQPVPVFKADHPFLFLIQEKQTGSVLFFGRLQNPASK